MNNIDTIDTAAAADYTVHICPRCKKQITEVIAYFETGKIIKTCSMCREKTRQYRENHKEEIKQSLKLYRESNKEKRAISNKKYRQENIELIRKKDFEKYYKNQEKILEQKREYHLKNRERNNERCKVNYSNNKNSEIYIRSKLFRNAKARAKKHNISFDIKKSDIDLNDFKCCCCGIDVTVNDNKIKDNSITLDRVIPSIGYVSKNIKILCSKCNRRKNDLTTNDLEKILSYIKSNE